MPPIQLSNQKVEDYPVHDLYAMECALHAEADRLSDSSDETEESESDDGSDNELEPHPKAKRLPGNRIPVQEYMHFGLEKSLLCKSLGKLYVNFVTYLVK